MKKGEFDVLMRQLRDQLRGMDLPVGKHQPQNNDNLRWLARNLAARNATHKAFGDVCTTLERLGHPVVGAAARP